MSETLRPRTTGELLGQTFDLLFSNLGKLIIIQLIFFVPVLAASEAIGLDEFATKYGAEGPQTPEEVTDALMELGGFFGFFLIVMALSPLPRAASILAISDAFTDRSSTISGCYAAALRRIIPLLFLMITLQMLAMVGCCLAIVGFFFFLARFYVTIQVMVLEEAGVGRSLRRSWELTRDYFWHVFAFWIVLALVGIMIGPVVQQVLVFFSAHAESTAIRVLVPIAATLWGGLVTSLLGSVGQVVIYFDLRTRKEALDLEGLVALVDQIGPGAPRDEPGLP